MARRDALNVKIGVRFPGGQLGLATEQRKIYWPIRLVAGYQPFKLMTGVRFPYGLHLTDSGATGPIGPLPHKMCIIRSA